MNFANAKRCAISNSSSNSRAPGVTLGEYDQVCIFEAPDDEIAANILLAADMLGNIRTQTMRAFTAAEMDKILARIP
jgi:uncharacterized protein with GYD domain